MRTKASIPIRYNNIVNSDVLYDVVSMVVMNGNNYGTGLSFNHKLFVVKT